MGEIRYMISEAAKRVHVESHVLRYWEEELNLTISRTEMGHRYYTEDDIQLFCCIKKLKNEGMLLKDLKPLIPKLKATRDKLNAANEAHKKTDSVGKEALESFTKKQEDLPSASEDEKILKTSGQRENIESDSDKQELLISASSAVQNSADTSVSVTTDNSPNTALAPTEAEVIPVTQLEQVRSLIGDVLNEVVTTNNAALEQSISTKVTKDVIREMDFLFQAKERQEEEHYRKLDCLIRQQQANRREMAERDTAFGKLKKMLT